VRVLPLREIRNYAATYIHLSTRVSESVSKAEIMAPGAAAALAGRIIENAEMNKFQLAMQKRRYTVSGTCKAHLFNFSSR